MDIPRYLQVLWQYRVLLLVGILVAAVAGFFAAYSVTSDGIEPRGAKSYTASTTLLLANEQGTIFGTQVPGTEVEEGVTTPTRSDLAQTAVLYAYLVSGEDIRAGVEAEIGPFADTEDLTALRRTTQPGSSDQASGRLTLPILEIYGTSSDPARAEAIAAAASEVFTAYVADQQDTHDIPADSRVVLTTLTAPTATLDSGGNPLVPAIFVGLATLLVWIIMIYVVDNVRRRRVEAQPDAPSRRSRRAAAPPADPVDATDDEIELADHVGARG